MDSPGLGAVPTAICPDCDRCLQPMSPAGWIPKPDGSGGLRRVTVYRCAGCARRYDALWGYHDAADRA